MGISVRQLVDHFTACAESDPSIWELPVRIGSEDDVFRSTPIDGDFDILSEHAQAGKAAVLWLSEDD